MKAVTDILTITFLATLFKALLLLVIGYFTAKIISSGIKKIFLRRASAQQSMILGKVTYYLIFTVFLASALRELDFDLSVVLGAAGILTVALGFASQTSVSNVISGLFLIADRPFQIGDIVTIGETTGIVNSIELLSVKIRTFQNGFVRIPNETIIKTDVLNHTHYPIRRIDIEVGVAYKEDIARVRDILNEVAASNPQCLNEPEPLFLFLGYGDSSIDLKFCVWTVNDLYLDVMNSMKQGIKEAFDKNDIEIPFPHRTLYTGSVTDPFPVTLKKEA